MRKLLAILILATGLVMTTASPAPAAPQRCQWLRPYLEAVGLPVETFLRISYRESGCAVNGVHVIDRDDMSTSRFGLNFKGRGMQRYWRNLCGATSYLQMRNVNFDVRCTAAAYRQMGLRPWR
jgi:hypothetical protein